MTDVPYPADTRAKGWRFEVDHERIRQSDTWALASPELRPWLLMLWMVAWEQTPCASLPDDEALIAARIGMPAKTLQKHKSVLLRGWQKASDGRLYHATMTERVLAMLEYRRKEAERRNRNRGKPHGDPDVSRGTPEGQQQESHETPDTGTGTGTTSEANASAGAAKPQRASRKCPKSFEPLDAQEWIDQHCPGVDWKRETDKFRDYTFKNAITDWLGAWRNWMRRAHETRRPGAVVTPINRQEAIEARNRAVGDEWVRQQEAMDASR